MVSKIAPVSGSERSCGSSPTSDMRLAFRATRISRLSDSSPTRSSPLMVSRFPLVMSRRWSTSEWKWSDPMIATRSPDDSCMPPVVDGVVGGACGDADLREDDAVAEFVREYVEVLAVGARVVDGAAWGAAEAEFEEPVAGLGVVPFDEWDHLQAGEV